MIPRPHQVAGPGSLLAECFAAWPSITKTRIRSWLKHRMIMVNGQPTTQFDHALHAGDVVEVRSGRSVLPRPRPGAGLRILHEDDSVLVVEKPAGLLSMASDSERERTAYHHLSRYARASCPNPPGRVWIVHRLDRETSGVMVFARTPEAKHFLQEHWGSAEKLYQAVVEGCPPDRGGTLESDLDESRPERVVVARKSSRTRHAVTHYEILAASPGRSLLALRLETGRRHQIRVQLAEIGCPIAGDEKYGARTDPAGRLALHACELSFPHPATGKMMRFVSPLPGTLLRLVDAPGEDRPETRAGLSRSPRRNGRTK